MFILVTCALYEKKKGEFSGLEGFMAWYSWNTQPGPFQLPELDFAEPEMAVIMLHSSQKLPPMIFQTSVTLCRQAAIEKDCLSFRQEDLNLLWRHALTLLEDIH